MKNCDNCYWQFHGNYYEGYFCAEGLKESPKENFCKSYVEDCMECREERAEYKYKGKAMCSTCLLEALDLEQSTTTHYYSDGVCLGSDDDFDEVIENLRENFGEDIEELEEE